MNIVKPLVGVEYGWHCNQNGVSATLESSRHPDKAESKPSFISPLPYKGPFFLERGPTRITTTTMSFWSVTGTAVVGICHKKPSFVFSLIHHSY
jgi:hypothetical protein